MTGGKKWLLEWLHQGQIGWTVRHGVTCNSNVMRSLNQATNVKTKGSVGKEEPRGQCWCPPHAIMLNWRQSHSWVPFSHLGKCHLPLREEFAEAELRIRTGLSLYLNWILLIGCQAYGTCWESDYFSIRSAGLQQRLSPHSAPGPNTWPSSGQSEGHTSSRTMIGSWVCPWLKLYQSKSCLLLGGVM
jgi:hypothetical protein